MKQKLATDVLQLTFIGYTGFRFPFAHFPTYGVKGSELHILFWNSISTLQSFGFNVDFVMQDGGGQNREFTKIQFFDSDPKKHGFVSEHLTNPGHTMAHCQDYSHNMKKLRNSIYSSGIHTHSKRHIHKNGIPIVWDHWVNAYKWDQESNSRQVYHKLTSSHLHPDSGEKMRNHLAEDVLNEDMLNLMKQYQISLINGNELSSTIEFLSITSNIVKLFRDPRPIKSTNDCRLGELSESLVWFQAWRDETSKSKEKRKEKLLPSAKCLDDIESLLQCFVHICTVHLSQFPHSGVVPSRFNSDLAENIFCQQRGVYNGNNTNPSYSNYCSSMNNIILGQSSKSRARKSNAGMPTADPYKSDIQTKKIKCLRF